MSERGPGSAQEKMLTKKNALEKIDKIVREVAEMFSEEAAGTQLMEQLNNSLPEQVTAAQVLETLNRIQKEAVQKKDPMAGIALNVLSQLKRQGL
jgi:hypothetical protein